MKTSSSWFHEWSAWLRRLDQVVDRWLVRLDERNAQRLRQAQYATMARLPQTVQTSYHQVWHGANPQVVKKRTGRTWLDRLSSWRYEVCRWLSRLDTMVFFRGKPYQAKTCRVRSKAEKKIANFLADSGLHFSYEAPLRLGEVVLHPDFYLIDYDVYVEYWGLADSDSQYNAIHHAKLSLYQQHGVAIISLYPRHLGHLNSVFPELFREATGKQLPNQPMRRLPRYNKT